MSELLDDMLRKASASLLNSDAKAAFRLLDHAVNQFPSDPRGWQMRGCVKHQCGECFGAIADLETAESLGLLCPAASLALADCYRRGGDEDRCTHLACRLVNNPNSSVKSLAQAACLLGSISEYSTALYACERILGEFPETHQAWFGVGFYRARLDFKCSQIFPFIAHALTLDPENSLYAANVGLLSLAVNHHVDGWSVLDEIEPASIGCPNLLRLIAQLYHQDGQFDLAKLWQNQLHATPGGGEQSPTHCQHRQHHARMCCVALPESFLEEQSGRTEP